LVIVNCAHYRDGRRQNASMLDLARAAEIAQGDDDDGFVWIGLVNPDPEELNELQARFGLNELAIEDAQALHLRPKVELYDEPHVLFCVVRSARYDDEHEAVEFGEVAIFLNPRFVISVRQGGVAELGTARSRLERRPDLVRHGSSAVLWAILDKMVDDYAPVVAGLEQDVDEIEQVVFGGSVATTERIYRLRGEATAFARAVHPLLGPVESLQRRIYPQIAEPLVPFFRDVNDHLKLVNEEVQSQRDALASILQANMAVISLQQTALGVRQNDAMRVLTVIATIFLPLTFLTGFFGMNFGWLVRRIDPFWVFAVFGMGSLIGSSLVLYGWFRHTGLIGRDRTA
jgi:magnesium transporter